MLSVLDKNPPDRIPWVPRLLLWYNARTLTGTMPKRWEGLSLREIEQALRLGTPAKDVAVFDVHMDGVEVVTRKESGKKITEYHTPKGSVRSVMHYSEELDLQGLPGRDEEYFLKGPKDFSVWEYVVEHMYWKPDYDAYTAYDGEIGGDGLPFISIGDVPFHEFAQKLAGYEYAFYHLSDYTAEVEHLLKTMAGVQREQMWPVVLESPARLVQHGVHLSSQFTPPSIFEKYILPYYEEFIPLLNEHGKSVSMHADNDTSQILDLIERAGWDVVECFVTAPMVPLTLEQAREAWGDRVIIWGGVPSLILSPSFPEEDFREYVYNIFKAVAPGNAFILGVADNVMPDSVIERVAWISDTVEERGRYPVG